MLRRSVWLAVKSLRTNSLVVIFLLQGSIPIVAFSALGIFSQLWGSSLFTVLHFELLTVGSQSERGGMRSLPLPPQRFECFRSPRSKLPIVPWLGDMPTYSSTASNIDTRVEPGCRKNYY